MKTAYFFVAAILSVLLLEARSVKAQEITVVDVKRNITLADDDVVYKDYYLNAGGDSVLRKNMVVNVKRKIHVKDVSTKSVGDFDTIVGQIKVIHIGNKVSVAREHKLTPRDEEPMLEQIGIMSGDRLDLKDSFIDNSKPAKHKAFRTEDPTHQPINQINLSPIDSAAPPARQPAQQPVAVPQI